MTLYDAFISYSHLKDKPVAAALQSAIQTLGKPWYRRRSLRIFRDDTSLSATPHLWPTIEQALSQSRYLILLTSPEAAASQWVDKEVAWWLEHKSVDTFLIAVTEGELAWDNERVDFKRADHGPLPPSLYGKFPTEPKWVDLRAHRAEANRRNAEFVNAAADLAATIRGVPKEDLLSQEVREQRRALMLAWTAAGTLAALAVVATWQTREAIVQRQIAENNARIATAARERAERNLSIANGAIENIVFRLAARFNARAGVPVELTRETLALANQTILQLLEAGESNPLLDFNTASAILLIANSQAGIGDHPEANRLLTAAIKGFEELEAKVPGIALFTSIAYEHHGDNALALNDLKLSADLYGKALAAAERARTASVDEPTVLYLLSTHNLKLGDVMLTTGSTEEASVRHQSAYDLATKLAALAPDEPKSLEALAGASERLGVALLARGDAAGARTKFIEMDKAAARRAELEPDNLNARNAVSISKNKLADVSLAMREFDNAKRYYEEGLSLAEQLTKQDPDRADWQRDLSISYQKLGDVLTALKQFDGALARHQSALKITQVLSDKHPEDYHWKWDLSLRHSRIGATYVQLDRHRDALTSFQSAAAIANDLTRTGPLRPDLLRDLSVYYEQIGDTLAKLGDADGSLKNYQLCLDIRKDLAEREPTRQQWQIDLAIAYERIADHYGNADNAQVMESLRLAEGIRAALLEHHLADPNFLRPLVEDRSSLATLLWRSGQHDEAILRLLGAVTVQFGVAMLLIDDPGPLIPLGTMETRLGDMLWQQGKHDDAVMHYEQALKLRERLVEIDGATEQWHIDLAIAHFRLAQHGVDPTAHLRAAVSIVTNRNANRPLSEKNRPIIALLSQALACAEASPSNPMRCFGG